jgi:hypothetical protein
MATCLVTIPYEGLNLTAGGAFVTALLDVSESGGEVRKADRWVREGGS